MRAQVQRILLAWMAVTALILTAACSKKDGGSTPPPAPAKKPAPPVIHESPEELERESGTSSNERAPRPRQDVKPVEVSRVPRRKDIRVVQLDPTGKTPNQIFRGLPPASPVEKMPEGVSVVDASPMEESDETDLVYSGSAVDDLRRQLEKSVSASQRNRKFAAEVGFTSFDVDWNSKSARLTVELELDGKAPKTFTFKGKLDKSGKFKSGDDKKAPHILVEATCMDRDGGCSTAHVRLTQKRLRGNRVAHVIARNTDAWVYSEGDDENSGNHPLYDEFIHVMKTSAHYPGGANSIMGVSFATSETIHGPSSFSVSLAMTMANAGQVQEVSFFGPLMKASRGDGLNLPLQVLSKRYARQSQARLVRNDGRGNLQIAVTFAKPSERSAEQTAVLTVARKHQLVRPAELQQP